MAQVLNTAKWVAFFASLIAVACGVGFTYMLCTMHQCQCLDISPVKPISVVDQTNAKEIEILKNRINEMTAEKRKVKDENLKKDQILAMLDVEIKTLEYDIKNVTIDYDHEKSSGEFYYVEFNRVEAELTAEKKTFEDLSAIHSDIIQNACGCQRCRIVLGIMQQPNWFANFQASRI